MKKSFTVFAVLCFSIFHVCASNISRIHENERETPFPQQGNVLYINPSPLLVPQSVKQSDYLQFSLSPSKDFPEENTILSKPVPWCMFNPHRTLENGTWYWRVRSVSKSGKEMPWSQTYSFHVTADVPQFVTPTVEVFLSNLPKAYPRIYCYLNGNLDNARKNMRQHPEFEYMIKDARTALGNDYTTDTKPYKHVSQMSVHNHNLNTAYQLMQLDVYAEKMVQNVRCLLAVETDSKVLENDFKAGELAYLLACTYENCHDRFTAKERAKMESLIIDIISNFYKNAYWGTRRHTSLTTISGNSRSATSCKPP